MTYGVPYSFVPGTKAKADEVNANFIDVLDKIQATNSRIDTVDTTIQECSSSLDTKLNLDLSNLDDVGKSKFQGWAKSSDLDGVWTEKYSACAANVTLSVGSTQTYSIKSLLPTDSNIYEVMISVTAQTANTSGATANLLVYTDKMKTKRPVIKTVSRHSNVHYDADACTVIVGTGRSISIASSSASVGVSTFSLEVYGYRKVR